MATEDQGVMAYVVRERLLVALSKAIDKWEALSEGRMPLGKVALMCSLCAYSNKLSEIGECCGCPLHLTNHSCFGENRNPKWAPQSQWDRLKVLFVKHQWRDETLESIAGFTHGYDVIADKHEVKFLIYQIRDLICKLYYEERDGKSA